MLKESYQTFLKRNRAALARQLTLGGELLDVLLEDDVITRKQYDTIKKTETLTVDQAKLLLDSVGARRDVDFERFCVALKNDEDEVSAAEILDELDENDRLKIFGGANVHAGTSRTDRPGNTHGANNYQGDTSTEGRRERFRTILLDNRPQLVQELNPKVGLFDYLLQDRVVDIRMKNKLTEEGTKEEQATELLDYLYNRPVNDMESFPRSLRKNNQPHLAALFQ